MKTALRFVVMLGVVVKALTAQSVDPTLATNLQRTLDSLRAADLPSGPGLSAALILPNGAVWKGTNNLTTDDLIGVASHTKTMIAALTMKLVEDGTLSLDDSLHAFLPPMTNINPDISIRQLLGMRAGINDYESYTGFWSGVMAASTTRLTRSQILAYVGTPLFQPGVDFEYVNTNFLLLEMIIEAGTGRDVQELMRERLWDPLGLTRIYYYGRDTLVPPVAPGHHSNSFWQSRMTSHFDRVFSTFTGAGNVFTTIEGLATWIHELYGSQSVLAPSSMQEVLLFYDIGSEWSGYPRKYTAYGLGTERTAFSGYLSIGHGGGLLAYSSHGRYIPELGITLAVAYNYIDDDVNKWMRIYSAILNSYLRWVHRPELPQRGSLIVAGGVTDSGAVYRIDTLTLSPSLIGHNFTPDISSLAQLDNGRLYAFAIDVSRWGWQELNGLTGRGVFTSHLNSFVNSTISASIRVSEDMTLFSYYGSLYRFADSGPASLMKTLFPGAAVTITGIDSLPTAPGLWLSVNFDAAQPSVLFKLTPSLDTVRVGSTGPGIRLNDIAFSPVGVLYGVTSDSPSKLVRIDTSDGLATIVGTLNLKDARAMAFTGDIGTSVRRSRSENPAGFVLGQNYPNPFNPKTNFEFRISDFGMVELRVFDLLGREVTVLVNEELQPGAYQTTWDAEGMPSGVYFCKLEATGRGGERFVQTRRMTLLR